MVLFVHFSGGGLARTRKEGKGGKAREEQDKDRRNEGGFCRLEENAVHALRRPEFEHVILNFIIVVDLKETLVYVVLP